MPQGGQMGVAQQPPGFNPYSQNQQMQQMQQQQIQRMNPLAMRPGMYQPQQPAAAPSGGSANQPAPQMQ
jgi:hypothetical protein